MFVADHLVMDLHVFLAVISKATLFNGQSQVFHHNDMDSYILVLDHFYLFSNALILVNERCIFFGLQDFVLSLTLFSDLAKQMIFFFCVRFFSLKFS